MRDTYGIIPTILSVLTHVLIFGGLFFAFDFSSPVHPTVPLAIEATLVTEADMPATSKKNPRGAHLPSAEGIIKYLFSFDFTENPGDPGIGRSQ